MLIYRGDGESAVSRWVWAKGMRALFDSAASVQHFVSACRMSKDYFCNRYFAQGVSDSYRDVRSGGGRVHFSTSAKNLARRLRWQIRSNIHGLLKPAQDDEKELAQIERSARAAYWRGYRFHNCEVRRNPAVRAWVLKDSYYQEEFEVVD